MLVASAAQRVHSRRDCGKIAFEIPILSGHAGRWSSALVPQACTKLPRMRPYGSMSKFVRFIYTPFCTITEWRERTETRAVARGHLSILDFIAAHCLVSAKHLYERLAGLSYDKQPVEAMTFPGICLIKSFAFGRKTFIRKYFRINCLSGSLCGTFSLYRHLGEKKFRLNGCWAPAAKSKRKNSIYAERLA